MDPPGPWRSGFRIGKQEKEEMTERTDYSILIGQAEGLMDSEPWYVAALSNISALIMAALPDLNWAGFYLLRDGRLVVGPFQGKPACIHIAPGKGVCGTAVLRDETVVVPDVHLFPGHIACDGASESEVVVPLRTAGEVRGVLDIDSPVKNRFSDDDREGLETLAEVIGGKAKWE